MLKTIYQNAWNSFLKLEVNYTYEIILIVLLLGSAGLAVVILDWGPTKVSMTDIFTIAFSFVDW